MWRLPELCILVPSQNAEPQEVKVGDEKQKSGTQTWATFVWSKLGQPAEFFSDLKFLALAVLKSLELQGCQVSHLKALIQEQLNFFLNKARDTLETLGAQEIQRTAK